MTVRLLRFISAVLMVTIVWWPCLFKRCYGMEYVQEEQYCMRARAFEDRRAGNNGPTWVTGVKIVDAEPHGIKEIRLSGQIVEAAPRIEKVKYGSEKGEVKIYRAKSTKPKFEHEWINKRFEAKYIIPEAEILYYLGTLNLPDTCRYCRALHFLQLQRGGKIGEKMILLEDLEESAPGETLYDKMAKGNISEDEAIDVTLKAAYTIQGLHEVGVYQGDITPENIWVANNGDVIMFDFGHGFRTREEFIRRRLYIEARNLYTPAAREGITTKDVILEKNFAFAEWEIYSLGMVLLDSIVGANPESFQSPDSYANSQLQLLELRHDVSRELKDFLNRAVSNGECAYKTAQEFIAALERCRDTLQLKADMPTRHPDVLLTPI